MNISPIHPQEPKPEYNIPFVPAFAVKGGAYLRGWVRADPSLPPAPQDEAQWFRVGIPEQTVKTFGHIQMIGATANADLTHVVKLTSTAQVASELERLSRSRSGEVRLACRANAMTMWRVRSAFAPTP